jgi:RNA polymerase sigma-70 factor, ECF subfamily
VRSKVADDVYAELRRHVTRAVMRLCPSWLSAERDDIIQLAMLRLHRTVEAGEESRYTSSSYIWQTAFSVVVDEMRRRGRRSETSLTDDDAGEALQVADAHAGPERQALARATGLAIRSCLATMSPTRRAAVVLHLQGHKIPEIARLLGWDDKKAENQVYRGLADLRRCLTAKGFGHDPV